MYQRLTANLVGANKRYEVLDGKTYLVVPMVSITEGVHNGTKGPLYYSIPQLSKNPASWNHKPLVVYHPEKDGEGITACDPDVVANQGVGTMYRTQWDGRLKHEAWLDEAKLKKVDQRVWDAISQNKMVEVSTGLFHDLDETPGTWNGEKYDASVINIVPDHVAILPDQMGACSTVDGAGLLRNADGGELSHDDIREQIRSLVRAASPNSYCYVCDVFKNYAVYEQDPDKHFKIGYKVKGNKVTLVGEPEQVRRMTSYVTANKKVLIPIGMTVNTDGEQDQTVSLPGNTQTELSDILKRQGVRQALTEKYPDSWATEVYGEFVVYFKDGKYFRLPYAYDGDKILFGEKSVEITKTGGYAEKTLSTNQGTDMAAPTVNNAPAVAQPVNDKAARIDALISKGGFTQEDKGWLSQLPDAGFERIEKQTTQVVSQPVNPFVAAAQPAQNTQALTNNTTPAPQQMTTEQYVQNAPPEIRDALLEAVQVRNAEKQRLIGIITSNANNVFSKEWLALKSPQELRGIAQLAAGSQPQHQPVHNYGGQGDVPMFMDTANAPTQNADHGQQVLQLPQFTFEAPQKRA